MHFLPTIVSVVVKHPIKHWAKKDFELPISTGFRPSHEHLLDIGVHGSVDWTSGFTDHKNHVAGKSPAGDTTLIRMDTTFGHRQNTEKSWL